MIQIKVSREEKKRFYTEYYRWKAERGEEKGVLADFLMALLKPPLEEWKTRK